MYQPQIECVLPLKPDNAERGSDLARARCLIASFERWCDPDFIACFTIVVPATDLAAAASLAHSRRLSIRVIAEDTLLKPPPPMPRHGWYVQQMIKIAYAGICRTSAYLTLDADVLLAAPLDAAVLAGGRIPIHPETVRQHPDWWTASAATLRVARSAADTPDQTVFGVTPAFLHTAVMRHAIRRLARLAAADGLDWPDYLAARTTPSDEKTWTEYSLYWTALINLWQPHDLHRPRRVYVFGHSVYEVESQLAGGGAPLFGVIQSSFVGAAEHVALARRLLARAPRP